MANGSKIGMAVGGAFAMIMVLIAELINTPLLGLSAWTVYFSMYASRQLYCYIITKEKRNLIQAIIGMFCTLAFFLAMIILGVTK